MGKNPKVTYLINNLLIGTVLIVATQMLVIMK